MINARPRVGVGEAPVDRCSPDTAQTPEPAVGVSIEVAISPGELIDKLTILEIKRERIRDHAKRAHVELEYAKLNTVFGARVEVSEPLRGLHDSLRDVNLRLWNIEDEIRECERRKDFGTSFVGLARSIYLTNDRRAEIKRAINALLDSELVEEKAYQAY